MPLSLSISLGDESLKLKNDRVKIRIGAEMQRFRCCLPFSCIPLGYPQWLLAPAISRLYSSQLLGSDVYAAAATRCFPSLHATRARFRTAVFRDRVSARVLFTGVVKRGFVVFRLCPDPDGATHLSRMCV